MPDLRKDPIVGRWVIIASARAKRPHDFDSTPQRQKGRFLPVLRGARRQDARRNHRVSQAGSQRNREGWRVRVVPNKFPALEIEAS